MSGTSSSSIDVYATPQTFMDMLIECAQFIDKSRHDQSAKEDVLDSMETRVSYLVGKLAAHPTCTSYAVPWEAQG
jgi:hypothetical protein